MAGSQPGLSGWTWVWCSTAGPIVSERPPNPSCLLGTTHRAMKGELLLGGWGWIQELGADSALLVVVSCATWRGSHGHTCQHWLPAEPASVRATPTLVATSPSVPGWGPVRQEPHTGATKLPCCSRPHTLPHFSSCLWLPQYLRGLTTYHRGKQGLELVQPGDRSHPAFPSWVGRQTPAHGTAPCWPSLHSFSRPWMLAPCLFLFHLVFLKQNHHVAWLA